jgi:hypothetical protein
MKKGALLCLLLTGCMLFSSTNTKDHTHTYKEKCDLKNTSTQNNIVRKEYNCTFTCVDNDDSYSQDKVTFLF